MADRNLSLIAAVIRSQTEPTHKEVVWAEQYDSNDLDKIRLKYYDHEALQWKLLVYTENNTYSDFHSGSLVFIADGEVYTEAIAKIEENLQTAYPNAPSTLSYSSGTVAWDMQNRRFHQAFYNPTTATELSFTIDVTNAINGGWSTLLIKQDADGTIEATVPSNSKEDADVADGDGVLTIYGQSGQWHIVTVFVYNDGSNNHFFWNIESYSTA